MGWPLVWVCGLPVRGVDLWLDVNDPRVVAEVGRDVDRRGHANRRGSRCGGGRSWQIHQRSPTVTPDGRASHCPRTLPPRRFQTTALRDIAARSYRTKSVDPVAVLLNRRPPSVDAGTDNTRCKHDLRSG